MAEGGEAVEKRADKLLATIWRCSRSKQARLEAVLEAALAAALEHPEIWPRLVTHTGWDVPVELPAVSTQDRITEGRTDIMLSWPDRRVVLELKVHEPPHIGQIQSYLKAGVDVIAVAALSGSLAAQAADRLASSICTGDTLATAPGSRFLGVTPWKHLRSLRWLGPETPLELRQLYHLLDATGVIMPDVTPEALAGLKASWTLLNHVDEWYRHGLKSVHRKFHKSGIKWKVSDGARMKWKPFRRDTRFAYRMWAPPKRQEPWLEVYVGLYFGSTDDPVLRPGFPDLELGLHLDPASPMAATLKNDETFLLSGETWRQLPGPTWRRFNPERWFVLWTRTSAELLSQAPDPSAALVDWLGDRCAEWMEPGLLPRVEALRVAGR